MHDLWAEHEDRTYIRDRRRLVRPAFVLGLILLAGCVATSSSWFDLPDWVGFVRLMAAFCGIGLVISPGCELISLRRDEARMRRRYKVQHSAAPAAPATPSQRAAKGCSSDLAS